MPSYITTKDRRDIIILPLEEQNAPRNESIISSHSAHDRLPFIEANTREVTLDDLKEKCIVPVFSKDNELTVSHQDFISAVYDAASEVFSGESVSLPALRVSHPIKGRTPEAVHKPVKDLLEEDKTIFYERMMFCCDIPSIYQDISGNHLNLTIGGVRAYNEQNLGTRKSAEKFKIFIGFKNMVCCNLCVSSDGYVSSLKAMDAVQIVKSAAELFKGYDMEAHLRQMSLYQNYSMNESQFAQFIGKCRMYQYLPNEERKKIPELLMTDTQIGLVAQSYYKDKNFGMHVGNSLSMWQVYNMLTGANKSSYIDNFLDRSLNASELATGLCAALSGKEDYSWFIS